MDNSSDPLAAGPCKSLSPNSSIMKKRRSFKPSDLKTLHSNQEGRDCSVEVKYECKNVMPLPMLPKKVLEARQQSHLKLPSTIKEVTKYNLNDLFIKTPVFEGPLIDFDAKEPLEESKWNKVSKLVLSSTCENSLKLIKTYKTTLETRDQKAKIPFRYEQVRAEQKKWFKNYQEIEKIEVKKKKTRRRKALPQNDIYNRHRDRIAQATKNSFEISCDETRDSSFKMLQQQITDIRPSYRGNTSIRLNKSRTSLNGQKINCSLNPALNRVSDSSLSRPRKYSRVFEPVMTHNRMDALKNRDSFVHQRDCRSGSVGKKYNTKNITGKSNLSFIKIRDLNNSTDKYIFEVDKAQAFFKRNNSQERYLKKKRTEELKMPHLKPKSITKRYRKLRNPSRNDQNIDSYHPSSIDREQGCYSKVIEGSASLSPGKANFLSMRNRSVSGEKEEIRKLRKRFDGV
ncbi:unnamed protein product [Moneuplotes crassus]|uniref:Uncharacterized protein n=1 Tax=Euplotes crassus TaxID=5936 RepID=A0AAD1UEC0_EUPCR|nr:unnamed protein product [Moneuplotes crassus]